MSEALTTRKDFFISYTSTDGTWAQWIAAQLEDAGYSTIIEAWDFRPGTNFVVQMNDATRSAARTIAVLSPAYLDSDYAFSEWAVAFSNDPRGKQGFVLPVRVQPCELEGLLRTIVYIDLVDLDEERPARRCSPAYAMNERSPTLCPFRSLRWRSNSMPNVRRFPRRCRPSGTCPISVMPSSPVATNCSPSLPHVCFKRLFTGVEHAHPVHSATHWVRHDLIQGGEVVAIGVLAADRCAVSR